MTDGTDWAGNRAGQMPIACCAGRGLRDSALHPYDEEEAEMWWTGRSRAGVMAELKRRCL
jgi:hypothetical protein